MAIKPDWPVGCRGLIAGDSYFNFWARFHAGDPNLSPRALVDSFNPAPQEERMASINKDGKDALYDQFETPGECLAAFKTAYSVARKKLSGALPIGRAKPLEFKERTGDGPVGVVCQYIPGWKTEKAQVVLDTRHLEVFPRWEVRNLVAHELWPGHHFQMGLQDIRDRVLFGNPQYNTGFAEGWGLFAEEMAHEHGFTDGYHELGYLNDYLLRVYRAKLDVAIHLDGMPSKMALDILLKKCILSKTEAEATIHFILAMPGRTLAYLAGYRVFERMIEEYPGKIIPTLKQGSVPLGLLS